MVAGHLDQVRRVHLVRRVALEIDEGIDLVGQLPAREVVAAFRQHALLVEVGSLEVREGRIPQTSIAIRSGGCVKVKASSVRLARITLQVDVREDRPLNRSGRERDAVSVVLTKEVCAVDRTAAGCVRGGAFCIPVAGCQLQPGGADQESCESTAP